jgi:hypothetical protein
MIWTRKNAFNFFRKGFKVPSQPFATHLCLMCGAQDQKGQMFHSHQGDLLRSFGK